jgi:hypothetical protein
VNQCDAQLSSTCSCEQERILRVFGADIHRAEGRRMQMMRPLSCLVLSLEMGGVMQWMLPSTCVFTRLEEVYC